MILEETDLNLIRQAIDVEVKHQYINIKGQSSTFSEFMTKKLMGIYKRSKRNPKWLTLMKAFEHYPFDTMNGRKKLGLHGMKMI